MTKPVQLSIPLPSPWFVLFSTSVYNTPLDITFYTKMTCQRNKACSFFFYSAYPFSLCTLNSSYLFHLFFGRK
ncbi:hypothetical protein EDC94DRAFT_614634 [Helicostylum pulchrum]|nr:hypothetical protein EDC94DRAFT_614634 [Helicostylum pulchrum]